LLLAVCLVMLGCENGGFQMNFAIPADLVFFLRT